MVITFHYLDVLSRTTDKSKVIIPSAIEGRNLNPEIHFYIRKIDRKTLSDIHGQNIWLHKIKHLKKS
jgi:hypothetical protein